MPAWGGCRESRSAPQCPKARNCPHRPATSRFRIPGRASARRRPWPQAVDPAGEFERVRQWLYLAILTAAHDVPGADANVLAQVESDQCVVDQQQYRGDLGGHFGSRQRAAATRLAALGELQFDHLDLLLARQCREAIRIEAAVGLTAPEMAGCHLPDQVAPLSAMVRADGAFAGVMRDPPVVHRDSAPGWHGRPARRSSCPRCSVHWPGRLCAVRPDRHAKAGCFNGGRCQRMVDPLEAIGPHVALDEVLADPRPNALEQVAQMADQRTVTRNGVARLQAVAQPDQGQQRRPV